MFTSFSTYPSSIGLASEYPFLWFCRAYESHVALNVFLIEIAWGQAKVLVWGSLMTRFRIVYFDSFRAYLLVFVIESLPFLCFSLMLLFVLP